MSLRAKDRRWEWTRQQGDADRFFRPATFLLLNPAAPTKAERELGGTSVYPNPATATSQLEYEVRKAGPVTVNP